MENLPGIAFERRVLREMANRSIWCKKEILWNWQLFQTTDIATKVHVCEKHFSKGDTDFQISFHVLLKRKQVSLNIPLKRFYF